MIQTIAIVNGWDLCEYLERDSDSDTVFARLGIGELSDGAFMPNVDRACKWYIVTWPRGWTHLLFNGRCNIIGPYDLESIARVDAVKQLAGKS